MKQAVAIGECLAIIEKALTGTVPATAVVDDRQAAAAVGEALRAARKLVREMESLDRSVNAS